MIVYAGKQFGNDFNNGDEGVFQDANRPRDYDKFKLLAGINTRKADFRTANSGIAAQGIFHSAKSQIGQSSLTDANGNRLFNTAYMKNKYSESDFAWTGDAANFVKECNAEIEGNPYVNANEGDIVVGKSGLYAVTCLVQFIAPASYSTKITSTTFSSSSAFIKFYVALMVDGLPATYTQQRGCGAIDAYSVFYVGDFTQGMRVNVGFLHTATSDTFTIIPSLNMCRLS